MRRNSTVIVIDDDRRVRESLTALLSNCGLLVQSYECPLHFLAKIEPSGIACLIVDMRMPKMNGIELQTELLRRGWRLPTIIITAYGDVPSTVKAMQLGAIDVVEKPFSPMEMVTKIRTLADDGTAGCRPAAPVEAQRSRVALLTQRERDVCRLLLQGLSSKQIAVTLGVSVRTAQLHANRVRERLGVTSDRELLRAAPSLVCALA